MRWNVTQDQLPPDGKIVVVYIRTKGWYQVYRAYYSTKQNQFRVKIGNAYICVHPDDVKYWKAQYWESTEDVKPPEIERVIVSFGPAFRDPVAIGLRTVGRLGDCFHVEGKRYHAHTIPYWMPLPVL